MSAPRYYDARFEAAKATDQSGQRGWHFPPRSSEAPRRPVEFYVWTALGLIVCSVPTGLLIALVS
jgi:hypothetical protein